MALRSTCPDVQQLRGLALGQLSPEEITNLHDHLAGCPDCQSAVGGVPTDDPLLHAMQTQPSARGPEDDMVERLIERLRALEPPPSGLASSETAVLYAASADTPAEPVPESYDFLAPPQEPGELGRLGPYRVLRALGSGGMGIVFEAEDPQLERKVALKVMKPSLAAHPEARKRFLREARTAAAFQHDHIVTIHQVGEDRGVPYLAMQLLEGESLESRLQREPTLPIAEVLHIGRQVAEGLAAAHARGLIHRDIKPANIWLEDLNHRDTEAQRRQYQSQEKTALQSDSSRCLGVSVVRSFRIKLLDFGLARAADDQVHMTQSGVVAGTPAYMAPEQASDAPIDHRCDLFSLGCVLYRMCTGELPFKGTKTITILWAMAVKEPASPRQLNPSVSKALSDLILRLLAKSPDDRPQSAREVAEALLTMESKLAVPPRPVPRRRRYAALAAAVVLALLLGVGGILYGPQVYRLATNQGQLVIETDDPDVQVIVKQKEQQVTIIDAKTKQEVNLKAGKYQIELSKGKEGLSLSTTEFTLGRGGKQIVRVRLEPDRSKGAGQIHVLRGHQDFVNAVAFCLGGTHVISASGDRKENGKWVGGSDFSLRLWDVKTGREVRQLKDHTDAVRCLAVSPDGKRAVSAGGDPGGDFSLRLWDLEAGKLIHRFEPRHTNGVFGLAFAADGKRVLSASDDRSVRLWDVATGKELRCYDQGESAGVWSVAMSKDGKRILSGNRHGIMRLWDAETGEPIRQFRSASRALGSVSFSPDDKYGLTQGQGSTAALWDLGRNKLIREFEEHRGWVGRVTFSPDGRRILSCGEDRTVRLWDVASGEELHRFRGHEADVGTVAFSPDGRLAVSGGWDKTVRIWRLPE